MSYMFYYCEKLLSFPDISKWNITNLKKMENMFSGCNIKNIPKKFK